MHEVYELSDTLDVDKTFVRAQKMAERTRKMGLTGGYTVSLGTITRDGAVYNVLVIEGEAPQYGEWTFVALVDRVGEGAVITGVPGYEGATVDRKWAEEQTCDHCKTDRYRTHTVVVEHPTQGRKRVGSTCVKDFLGWKFGASFIPDFSEFISEGGGGSFAGFEAEALLAHAHSVIRQAGWVSASNDGYGVTPTAHIVDAAWGAGQRRYEYLKEFGEPTEDDWAAAAACGKWIASIDAYRASEYEANLHRAFMAEYVDWKHKSLVVSGMAVYLKSESRRIEREAREAAGKDLANELFAPVGTKVTVDVVVTRVTAYDGHYGVTYFNKFESATHRFEWATKRALTVGAKLTITGTVKGQTEYREQVSTDLTRCKVTERSMSNA
jgi:hypothetical protein